MTESRYIPSSLSNDFHIAHPDSLLTPLPTAGPAGLRCQRPELTPTARSLLAPRDAGDKDVPISSWSSRVLRGWAQHHSRHYSCPASGQSSPAGQVGRPGGGMQSACSGGMRYTCREGCDPPAPEGCDLPAPEGCAPPALQA